MILIEFNDIKKFPLETEGSGQGNIYISHITKR